MIKKNINIWNWQAWMCAVVLYITASFSPVYLYAQTDLVNIKNGALVHFSDESLVHINGSMRIDNGADFNYNGLIEIIGDWINNGTQNSGTNSKVVFLGNTDSHISGSGTSNFQVIAVTKTSVNNEVQVLGLIIAPDGFLELNKGAFHFLGTFNFSNTFFTAESNVYTINDSSAFILDNPNAIVSGQNAGLYLDGNLTINKGIFNIGNGANQNHLIYTNKSSITLGNDASAVLNIDGQLSPSTESDTLTYTQSGGKTVVGKAIFSYSSSKSMFDIPCAGSIVNMSGGTIELQRPNVNFTDLRILSQHYNVSGGTLLINSQTNTNEFSIQSKIPFGNYAQAALNNPIVTLLDTFRILHDITLAGSGSSRLTHDNNSPIYLGGNWTNNFSNTDGYNHNNGAVNFFSNSLQKIQGSINTEFYDVNVNKSGSKIELDNPTTISHYLKLLSDSALIDIQGYDLTIKADGKIFSDNGTNEHANSFSASKCIVNSGSSSNPLLGGHLVRYLPATPTFPLDVNFPITTPNVYTPGIITLLNNGAILGNNAKISIKPVPLEHPAVERQNVSLRKYWVVSDSNVTINPRGANVFFYYSNSEVRGNEGNYSILLYSPSYNNPLGYWRTDPGVSDDIVDFNQKLFYSQQDPLIEGDWTVGEPDASQATYFSRQDGDYSNPNTWSKVAFGGVVSNTAPNKLSDKVRIQNNTVIINNVTAPVGKLSVEDGTEGRKPGKLVVNGNNYVIGDSAVVEQNASLSIGNADGLLPVPVVGGAFRTNTRILSSLANYEYNGTNNQVCGSGLPDNIRSLIISKGSSSTLTLDKSITINDSLIINNGIFDLGSNSANGISANKTLIMRGGELIVRSVFPSNYAAPLFSAGRVTFDGTGNTSIPSSLSTPGVGQYYDLKIAGANRAGNITFHPEGEIKISDSFDISSLQFADNTWRFFTDGSTMRFNSQSAMQNIPCKPQSPADSVSFLEYYNLILDGNTVKQLSASGTPTFKVLKDLTITNNAAFQSNNFNLEIQGNWLNQSGTFTPGTSGVIFRSPVAMITNSVTSRNAAENYFNKVLIAGAGIVQINDNIQINSDLTISNSSSFSAQNYTVDIKGNWMNQGGTFIPGTSTVIFDGSSTQYLSKVSGNTNFYNLTLNNSNNLDISQIGTNGNGTLVQNTLTLNSGNIKAHNSTNYRYITVLGDILRPGNGFIDGELRKNVSSDNANVAYEVGYLSNYTPVNLTFSGTGGNAGLIGVLSDTITTSTSPVKWTNSVPDDIYPLGSTINNYKHVARQWTVSVPSGSNFTLGARTYNALLNFIPGASPSGDIRNSAITSEFEARLWTGTAWINPYYYTTKPLMGARNTSSTQFTVLNDFGTFIIGEPGMLTFYSRANDIWNNANSWSTQGYGGVATTVYPGQTTTNYRALIGNNNTISLTSNVNITNSGSNTSVITIDSSGTLLTSTYVISGAGEFRIAKDGTLGVGSTAGITASSASGNIQTNTRNYNYGNFNRSHFIYTDNLTQVTGDGLPAIFSTLTVDKSGTNAVTINSNVTISDSLYLKTGNAIAGANFTINGNIRRNSGTGFNPSTYTISLSSSQADTLTNLDANPFTFYNLNMNKLLGSGAFLLWDNSNLQINGTLTFSNANGYKSLIDARTRPSNYVILGTSASISNPSNTTGWVNGELRKNVITGATTVLFEIGDSLRYSPLQIAFRSGSQNGTAGYLAAKVFPNGHPYHTLASNPPIHPSRTIGPKYWRLTLPNGSTFARGNRYFDPRVYYIVPGDDAFVDYWGCADLCYLRKWTGGVDWQPMYPNNSGANDGGQSCSDTRNTSLTPRYTYSGAVSSELAYINVANVGTAFGSTEMIGSDLLLADFIAGNQYSMQKFYNFYSIKDGNWSDPTSWSTVGFNSTVNEALTDTDPIVKPVPARQYDNAIIGNGKKITLDCNVGISHLDNVTEVNSLAGPSVVVQNTGHLDFGCFVLRGMSFSVENGGTVSSGAATGINTSGNTGNVILITGSTPKFNDSVSVIYTADGYTTNIMSYNGIIPDRDGTTDYIESVTVTNGDGTTNMTNTTNSLLLRSSDCINFYLEKTAVLTAGQTYSITMDPSTHNSTRYFKVWIDYNRNGTFDNPSELLFTNTSFNSNDPITRTFTVPAGTAAGSCQMRVMISYYNDAPGADGTGEIEDYSVKIINPSTVISQVTGNGLPQWLRTFGVHSLRSSSNVTLGRSINVIDSVKLISGELLAGANTINLTGSFVNDSLNAFNPQNSTVNLYGIQNDTIKGNSPVAFNNLTINKNDNSKKVNILANTYIMSNLSVQTDNNLRIGTANTLTMGMNSTLSAGSGSFGPNRMVEIDTNSSTIQLSKQLGNALSYCDPSLAANNIWITEVQCGGIDNNSLRSNYSDFTFLTPANLNTGSNTISLTKNTASSAYWYVWVDLNKNGTFDASELLVNGVSSSATTYSTNINIPSTALSGLTRMRVKVRSGANNNACESSSTDGEFEDYAVNITNSTNSSNYSFTFPIGVAAVPQNIYNPAQVTFTSLAATGNPSLSLTLFARKHPHRLAAQENTLSKYWKFTTNGVGNVSTGNMFLTYQNSDVNGNTQKYVPSRYRDDIGWEINLGAPLDAKTSPISIYNIPNGFGLDGEWTAGEPLTFFEGRIFYSINSGDWNNRMNWSTDTVNKHAGKAASYYPGQLYINDIVNIDGHNINFNLDSLVIDSLRLGGTNSNGVQGVFSFGDTPLNKKLTVKSVFLDNDNGLFTGTNPSGTRIDTLCISQLLINNSNSSGGFFAYKDEAQDDYTVINFVGSGNVNIYGEGTWGHLGNIMMSKSDGLLDSIIVTSSSFCVATQISSKVLYYPYGGVLTLGTNNDLYISNGIADVYMYPYSGIEVRKGNIRTKSNLYTNNNTFLRTNGGNLIIGNTINQNLYYKTGTTIDINNGLLNVAGCFTRALTNSSVNFSMSPLGQVKVLTLGSTDLGNIGFDISNSSSSFSMSGGNIIIANANGTSPGAYDFRVNALNGSGMTAGTIQSGDTILTPTNTLIKIGGNMPIANLHFANAATNKITTQITEEHFYIKNNWTIDVNHQFNLNGNTVNLSGNLTNYGTFIANPSISSTDPWQIVLDGSIDQNLFCSSAPGFELYNLRLDKSAGNVNLSSTGNTNLIIRNILDFAANNRSMIIAPIENERYVEISPEGGSNPQILRTGLGHIVGRLYRYVGTGPQSLLYPVGADTITTYRPALFETDGNDNTAGLVGIVHHNYDHPDISDAGIKLDNNIQKFWTVNTNGFSLGTNRNYSLTLGFLNPNDIRNGANPSLLEQYRYSPACPDPPAVCNGSGTWSSVLTPVKTDTTLKSTGNTVFGDFVIGEPQGITFYSYRSGAWTDPNTWSLSGYETADTPSRWPDLNSDIVRIGNDKTVTVPDSVNPNVKSVYVEKYNNLPGTIMIMGNLGYISGTNFVLEDDCTIGVQNMTGIAPASMANAGAVRTDIRTFGISRYLYNTPYKNQITGKALPLTIKALIIDNPSFDQNTVFMSPLDGNPGLTINDSLFIRQGVLNSGNRTLTINKAIVLDSVVNDGKFEALDGTVNLSSANDKYIVLKNQSGITFNNLQLNSGNIYAQKTGLANSALSHIYVKSNLNFAGQSMFILGDSVNLTMLDSNINAISNYASDRFILTSKSSGSLIRTIIPGTNTFVYPLGSLENGVNVYAPVQFLTASTGTTGHIGVRTSSGSHPVLSGGHLRLSGNPASEYLKRYYAIDSVSAQINGQWIFNYTDSDISGLDADFTKVARWKPSKEKTPGLWSFPFAVANINAGSNLFQTAQNYSYDQFEGDWTLGNDAAFRRIFYSRQSGLWNDGLSWTYNSTHSGVSAAAYPDSPLDSVVIGGGDHGAGNHVIALNVNNPLGEGAGVAVGTGVNNTGTLDLGENILNGDNFTLGDYSTLRIGSVNGISSLGENTGNIQTTVTRNYSSYIFNGSNINVNGIFEYSGGHSQQFGSGLPSTVRSLIINNSGSAGDNIITSNKNIAIMQDLSILKGIFDISSYTANNLSSGGNLRIDSNASLKIGSINDLSVSVNNYSSYYIDTDGIIEFYGSDQNISKLPVTLTQDFVNSVGGLGIVVLSNSGTKLVNSPLLIRGDLINNSGATLLNNIGVNALSVRRNIINSSGINNNGVIEIGN